MQHPTKGTARLAAPSKLPHHCNMARAEVTRGLAVLASITLTAAVAFGGCGGSDSSEYQDTNDAAADGSSGASGTLGTSSGVVSSGSSGTSSGATSSSGAPVLDANIPDVSFYYDAPVKDSALTTDSSCAQIVTTATPKPLDMYVMLDQSGSMGADCDVGSPTASKWCYAINALSTYFSSPGSTGNAAALQYFALSGGTCGGAGYDVSEIPSAGTGYIALPSNAFDVSLNAHVPNTGTPTEGALRGIVGFTSKPINRRQARSTIGILITDGDPSGCNGSISNLAKIVSDHQAATGIPTFVIGMPGANFGNLEVIAAGGGAPQHADAVGSLADACGNGAGPCRHWNVGNGDAAAFVEALKAIQGLAVGCNYAVPKTSDAGVVNPDIVKIEYLVGGLAPAKPLNRVLNAAACVADGWYYDNNAAPTTIQFCPAACNAVLADSKAQINVLLGCQGG